MKNLPVSTQSVDVELNAICIEGSRRHGELVVNTVASEQRGPRFDSQSTGDLSVWVSMSS